jgi:LmbE family N-acetylglucosaminyl deacetylase
MIGDIKRCLVVVAHPDDEVLGCGGLIKKLTSNKTRVLVLFINDGYKERFEEHNVIDIEDEKYKQIEGSSEQLGFDYIALDYEASRFDNYNQRLINDEVDSVIKQFNPDTIMTHSEGDLHQDHLVVNKSVMICSRSKENSNIKRIITFPTQSSSEINPTFNFKPNLIIDIEDYMDFKIKAMDSYTFEHEDISRSNVSLLKWVNYWGLLSPSKRQSEPYEIKRIYN